MLLKNWFTKLAEHNRHGRMKRRRGRRDWQPARPAAECLESRALLSNVAVTAQAGVITLTGDTGAHAVAAAVVGGQLQLTGSNGTEFTFNGNTAATVDVPLNGSLQALHVNFSQSGTNADSFTFDGTGSPTISGDVVIKLADGADTVSLGNATVKGVVDIHGGNGGDSITVQNDTVGGLAVITGSGNDTILVSSVTIQGPGNGNGHGNGNSQGQNGNSQGQNGNSQGQNGNSQGQNGNGDLIDGNAGTTGRPLVISTGDGDDSVTVDSVASAGKALGSKWQITIGAGNDTVNMNADSDHGFLTVQATGSGNDTVTIGNSTFGKQVNVALLNGTDQINLNGDTFGLKASFSTGTGAGSISVDESTFDKNASFAMAGNGAILNLETANVAGVGTVFGGPVTIALNGASAIANLGTNTVGDRLTFDKVVHITGGTPAATINVHDANVTFDKNVKLTNAVLVHV